MTRLSILIFGFILLLAQNAVAVDISGEYETLPCPSVAQANHLFAQVNWKGSDFTACDSSSVAKLAKVLFFISRARFKHLPEIPTAYENDLLTPWTFLTHHVSSMTINNYHNAELASNTNRGQIEINESLFTNHWTSAVSTLIHEAAHSRAEDPGHIKCEQGFARGRDMTCDAEFAGKVTDGAWGYQLWTDLALARYLAGKPNHNLATKMALREAQSIIVNMVNSFAGTTISRRETVWGLSEDGRHLIALENPKFEIPLNGEKLTDIFGSAVGNRIASVNSNGELLLVDAFAGPIRDHAVAVKDLKIIALSPCFENSAQETFECVLTNNQIGSIVYDASTKQFGYQPLVNISDLQPIAMSRGARGALFVRAENGSIFIVRGKNLIPLKTLGTGWKSFSGDSNGEGLFAIDQPNRLLFAAAGSSLSSLAVTNQFSESIDKVIASSDRAFVLTSSGNVEVASRNNLANWQNLFSKQKIIDIATVSESLIAGVPLQLFLGVVSVHR